MVTSNAQASNDDIWNEVNKIEVALMQKRTVNVF